MEEILQEMTSPTEEGTPEEAAGNVPEEGVSPPPATEEQAGESPKNEPSPSPDFEEMAAHDLQEIKSAFPELSHLESLTELSGLARYGELREAGLSAVEAAAATQYERLRKPREDTRAHLSSSVPRHTSPSGGGISIGELSAARDLFPTLSDREIEALYKRASRKRPQ